MEKEKKQTNEEKLNEFKTPLKIFSPKTKKYIFIGLIILFLSLTILISYKAINKQNPSTLNEETQRILVGEVDITGVTEEEMNLINNNLSLTVPDNSAYCIGKKINNICEGTLIESGVYRVDCEEENDTLSFCYANIPLSKLHKKDN